MIDLAALQMVLSALTGWFERREREAIAYLIDENRLLRRRLCQRGGRGRISGIPSTTRDKTPLIVLIILLTDGS